MKKPHEPSKQRGLSLFARLEVGQEQHQFIENFSMLIASGMDVLVALDAVRSEARSSSMRRVIDQIKADVDAGKPIWQAFEHVGFLPSHVISLIRIGEEAGRLPENFSVISAQQQKERSFRSKLLSAMLYPMIVFGVTIIVGVLISWFVLPRLATVFSQLNVELPLVTKLVIAFGNFLGQYGIYVIPIVIFLIILLFWILFLNESTKIAGERLLRIVPGVQRIVEEIEVARFSYVLGSLLEAGLPVVDALQSIVDATPVITYRRVFQHIRGRVNQGDSFQKAFTSYSHLDQLLPVPIQQLVVSAEQSGNLPDALLLIGKRYEEKTDTTTKNLVVVLEPILLVFVWIGVMLVAIAVILPIYRLVGQFDATTAGVPDPSAAQASTSTTGTVAGAHVRVTHERWLVTVLVDQGKLALLRDRPSSAGKAVSELTPGTTYTATQQSGGWYRIGAGWVSADVVDVVPRSETQSAQEQ